MDITGHFDTPPSRIAIWGPPSSGKSYLSNKLGKKYNITNRIHTDDYLSWNPRNKWKFMEKPEFMQKVTPLLNKSKWIVDGNLGEYVSREEILEMADQVIILNPSYIKLIYRIITRGITRNYNISLGTHTHENATIKGKFDIFAIISEMVDSIRIISSFKKSYVHYLLGVAKKTNNFSKIKIKS